MSKTIAGALAGIVRAATVYAKPWRRSHLRLLVSERLYERHTVETRHGPIKFVTTSARALGGPKNFFTDEPETLAWIDGFPPDAVFWDIGANVGQYTMYAARCGLTVVAFEPAPNTYAALSRNLAENALRIDAYCLALSERTQLGTLYMTDTHAASVFNAFESTRDSWGRDMTIEHEQPAVGISADDFVTIFEAPWPTHIKIDVDSTEVAILRGARRVLEAPTTRSVLIENTAEPSVQNRAIAELMAAAGFRPTGRGSAGSDIACNVIFERTNGAMPIGSVAG